MTRLSVAAAVLATACVTESLTICVNCGGLRLVDLRGSYGVSLTAETGVAGPCGNLLVQMAEEISWDGCLSPQGGWASEEHGIIRLAFVDSSGMAGTLEFYDLAGVADSAVALWRSSCGKVAPSDTSCPRGSGTASWYRSATMETTAPVTDPPP